MIRFSSLFPVVVVAIGCASVSDQTERPASTSEAEAGEPEKGTASAPEEAGRPQHNWCDQSYSNTPCIFKVYGECMQRRCTTPECDDPGFAVFTCPPGDPPDFMNKRLPCGRQANEPVVPRESNYDYSPDCDEIETRWANVAHEDRVCSADSDCTMATGNCFAVPLNTTGESRPEMQEITCSDPAAGACVAEPAEAACRNGCCVDEQYGGFGSVTPVYPRIVPP